VGDMAVGLSKHVKALRNMNIKVMVSQSTKDNSKYVADIIVNGRDSLSIEGFLNRKDIINELQGLLRFVQAYPDFLANALSEEDKRRYLNELRLHLELALAYTLAYEIAKD
jgi:hypothetical protein